MLPFEFCMIPYQVWELGIQKTVTGIFWVILSCQLSCFSQVLETHVSCKAVHTIFYGEILSSPKPLPAPPPIWVEEKNKIKTWEWVLLIDISHWITVPPSQIAYNVRICWRIPIKKDAMVRLFDSSELKNLWRKHVDCWKVALKSKKMSINIYFSKSWLKFFNAEFSRIWKGVFGGIFNLLSPSKVMYTTINLISRS